MIIYWTGQSAGLGDCIKGLTALRHFAESLNHNVLITFVATHNEINRLIEIHEQLEECELLSLDVNLEHAIISDFFLKRKNHKAEIIYTDIEKFEDYTKGMLDPGHVIDIKEIDAFCEEHSISPSQLFSFRYTPLPYWKFKTKATQQNSNIVTCQFSRANMKGLIAEDCDKIRSVLEMDGYEVRTVDHCKTVAELIDAMSESVFHVSPASGTAHVSHAMCLPNFIITSNVEGHVWQTFFDYGNMSYSPTKTMTIDQFVDIKDFNDEVLKAKLTMMYFYENDIKFYQVMQRANFEYERFIMKRKVTDIYDRDIDLINKFAELKTRYVKTN